MSSWRRGGQPFDPRAVDEYVRCFSEPAAIHASCEDYRAAVGTDLDDDDAAAARGQKVIAPVLALWGEHGFVGRHYGDVAAIWREYAENVQGRSLPAAISWPRNALWKPPPPCGTSSRIKVKNSRLNRTSNPNGIVLRPPLPMTPEAGGRGERQTRNPRHGEER